MSELIQKKLKIEIIKICHEEVKEKHFMKREKKITIIMNLL